MNPLTLRPALPYRRAMYVMSRRHAVLALLATPLTPVWATPVSYRLDTQASKVQFAFSIAGLKQTGTMPVQAAQITVDPQNLSNSRFQVDLDAASARTTLDIAAKAMTGPEILDTDRFPKISFETTSVQLAADQRLSQGATIRGNLTIRDITHLVQLKAELYRPRNTAPGDLNTLSAHLSGQVSRSRFGATGYADLVDDTVGLDITAVVHAAG